VSQTPETVQFLVETGWRVFVEKGAGKAAGFTDSAYEQAGAKIVRRSRVWKCDVVAKVQPPSVYETSLLDDRLLVSFVQPDQNIDLVDQLQCQGATCFAMDNAPSFVPRAKAYCGVASQANIAGYRAVVEATHEYKYQFCGEVTQDQQRAPAQVLVIGGGIAGLSAISTAKSMGAVVRAYDTRPETQSAIEAAGGEFLNIDEELSNLYPGRQSDIHPSSDLYRHAEVRAQCHFINCSLPCAQIRAMAKWTKDADVIISTAFSSGKLHNLYLHAQFEVADTLMSADGRRSPAYITSEMVSNMRPGSVIVDMAASRDGGNCEITEVRPGIGWAIR